MFMYVCMPYKVEVYKDYVLYEEENTFIEVKIKILIHLPK